MIKQKKRFAVLLVGAASMAIAGGSTTALADRDHPEDGPHHSGQDDSATAGKHYEGKVLSTNRSPRRFKIRTEGGQKRTFRVNGKTRFERISGFGGLDRGLGVEVNAKRTRKGLLATKVETRGGGGGGGSDDRPGDDHGSGGHGSDDGPNHT